ncbi:MAG TPA: hypothetical protein DCY48_00540 [Candidatus Magasanikbacteria bacterium]|nr:MAG: hypothetical protein A3I74_02560 [Candidatus Magasanikbacteria bacterium RIFCSPLOWO2_02_FULL_47_16]OGH79612.1 MAG: hypothetical protein A3C10_00840 [Candidatus Magasanikbacteria bacterium RIFCSPHIGHO2_02_FULL_48_18]OGH82028.1 MAG: hypothetical protein A3G08_02350 [Candidatus Magasanikbacteria bacterium RIFCSPLOWO2_12_FULL_47_9b]HAZ28251.1 hypothetical protein [Candidatus Magasanikbacteria bacterium]
MTTEEVKVNKLGLVIQGDGTAILRVTQDVRGIPTKADALRAGAEMVRVGIVDGDEWLCFVANVRASRLSNEGMGVDVEVCCTCGTHVNIRTWAGIGSDIRSLEELGSEINRLLGLAVITADQATPLFIRGRVAIESLPASQTTEANPTIFLRVIFEEESES